MDNLETTDSTFTWSVTLPTGSVVSTNLPRTVRTFEQFAKVDTFTGESDPTYWAIANARLTWGPEWATRFCVAMLAYYHTGTACDAAEHEGKDFWDFLDSVFSFAPRASERRHFRGHNGQSGLLTMKKLAPNPNNFFDHFPQTYSGVRAVCENKLSQFGPYFQLKICDYMDRCLFIPIQSWAGLAVNLPSEPLKVITSMFPDDIPYNAFNALCEKARDWNFSAAPLFDRPIGPPEIETFMCDWKRISKSRRFGDDVKDKRDALWGYSGKAPQLIQMFPPIVKETFKVEI